MQAERDRIWHCSPLQQPPVFGPAHCVLTPQIVPGPCGVPSRLIQVRGAVSSQPPLGKQHASGRVQVAQVSVAVYLAPQASIGPFKSGATKNQCLPGGTHTVTLPVEHEGTFVVGLSTPVTSAHCPEPGVPISTSPTWAVKSEDTVQVNCVGVVTSTWYQSVSRICPSNAAVEQ